MHVYDATFIKKDATKAALLIHGLIPWLQEESARVESPYRPYALFLLATCYAKGLEIEQNLILAVKLYTDAAQLGYNCAQNALAKCYKQGIGAEENLQEAMHWFNLAAQSGHAEAQYHLGFCYEHGVTSTIITHHIVHKDPAQALSYYQLSAIQGNAHALYSLGWYLRQHQETHASYGPMSFRLFLIAAEKGFADAQYLVGLTYDVGSTDAMQKDSHAKPGLPHLVNMESLMSKHVRDPSSLSKDAAVDTSKHANDLLAPKTPVGSKTSSGGRMLGILASPEIELLSQSVFTPTEKQRFILPSSPANFSHSHTGLSSAEQSSFSFPAADTTTPLLSIFHSIATSNHTTTSTLRYASPNPAYSSQVGDGSEDEVVPTHPNPIEAFRWYLLAAEQGHASAQCNVGYAFMTGEGVSEEFYDKFYAEHSTATTTTSDHTASKSTNSTNSEPPSTPRNNLSSRGRGQLLHDDCSQLEEDYRRWREQQAVQWYTRSASQGFAEGQYNLGLCYWHGDGGVAKSLVEAMAHFGKAATSQHVNAQYALARCHRQLAYQQYHAQHKSVGGGSSSSSNISCTITSETHARECARWSASAAKQGHVGAMYLLAECYEYGFGLSASATDARKWYENIVQTHSEHSTALENNVEEDDGSAAGDDGLAEAWFRLAYANYPPVSASVPQIASQSSNGSNGTRIQVWAPSLPKAEHAIEQAARWGHVLARGHVARRIEQRVLYPCYNDPSLSKSNRKTTIKPVKVEKKEPLSSAMIRRHVPTMFRYYACVARRILSTLFHRLTHLQAPSTTEALTSSTHRPSDIWQRVHERLLQDIFTSSRRCTHSDSAAEPDDNDRVEKEDLLWWLAEDAGVYQWQREVYAQAAYFMARMGERYLATVDQSNDDGTVAEEEDVVSDIDNISAIDALLQNDSEDVTAIEEDPDRIWDLLETLLHHQTKAFFCEWTSRIPCTDGVNTDGSEWTLILLLYQFASEFGGHEKGIARWASLLVGDLDLLRQPMESEPTEDVDQSESPHSQTQDNSNTNSLDFVSKRSRIPALNSIQWLALLGGVYRPINDVSMSSLPASTVASTPSSWWAPLSALVGEIPNVTIVEPSNHEKHVDIQQMRLLELGLQEFLQVQALVLWHALVSTSGDDSYFGKDKASTQLAQYHLGLGFESLANALTKWTELLSSNDAGDDHVGEEEEEKDARVALRTYFMDRYPDWWSLYTPFQHALTTATGHIAPSNHSTPAASPARLKYVSETTTSPSTSLVVSPSPSHPSSACQLLFPTVITGAVDQTIAELSLDHLVRRLMHYQHLCQDQAVLYFHSAAGGPASDQELPTRDITTTTTTTTTTSSSIATATTTTSEAVAVTTARKLPKQPTKAPPGAAPSSSSSSSSLEKASATTMTTTTTGYYLAQYSLAWSCEQQRASSVYGDKVRQEMYWSKYWYTVVVSRRLPALMRAMEQFIACTNAPNDDDDDNDDDDTSEKHRGWETEDRAERRLFDVYPDEFTETQSPRHRRWSATWSRREETISDACYAIAQWYQAKDGDSPEAIPWYERAIAVAEGGLQDASRGHADALYHLGCLFAYGDAPHHIPVDPARARGLLRRSADLGNDDARHLLDMSVGK
jgi:hypothetical protein